MEQVAEPAIEASAIIVGLFWVLLGTFLGWLGLRWSKGDTIEGGEDS